MLYPSILTDTLNELQHQLILVKDVPGIEVFQIDIVDGHFADNLTLGPAALIEADFGQEKIDLHLMVEEPLDYVFETIEVQDVLPVRAVIAQVERMSHQAPLLEEIKKHEWLAGLSLDLFTPLEAIEASAWAELDIVQLMSIEAGFQGQEFHSSVFPKLAELLQELERRQLRDKIEIIIDGGVKPENLEAIYQAGADSVTVGSAFWLAEDGEAVAREMLR